MALTSPMGFLIALDMDLNAVRGPLGRVRELAIGTEARLMPRAYVARRGFRLNTLGDEPGGHAPAFSVGGSLRRALVALGRRRGDVRVRRRPPRLGCRRPGRVLTSTFSASTRNVTSAD